MLDVQAEDEHLDTIFTPATCKHERFCQQHNNNLVSSLGWRHNAWCLLKDFWFYTLQTDLKKSKYCNSMKTQKTLLHTWCLYWTSVRIPGLRSHRNSQDKTWPQEKTNILAECHHVWTTPHGTLPVCHALVPFAVKTGLLIWLAVNANSNSFAN